MHNPSMYMPIYVMIWPFFAASYLIDVYSAVLSEIFSGILFGTYFGTLFGIYPDIDEGHLICQISWHLVWRLRSSGAHCDRTLKIEVHAAVLTAIRSWRKGL